MTPEQYQIMYSTYPDNTHRRYRIKFMEMYGDHCANPNCNVPGGDSDPTVLTIDHIDGGGEHARRKMWDLGYKSRCSDYAYKEALETYNPNRYRVLCWSCQHKTKLLNGLRGGGHAKVMGQENADTDYVLVEDFGFGMFEGVEDLMEAGEVEPHWVAPTPTPEYNFGLFEGIE